VTNVTFIFDTFPNTKPKEKKVGGHGILHPHRLKKWGDTSPVSLRKKHRDSCAYSKCSAETKSGPGALFKDSC